MKAALSLLAALLVLSCDAALRGENDGNRVLSSPSSQVTTFQLINADTDQKIVDLEDGMVIALNAIPNMTSPSFNINATVAGSNVQSVKFGYNSTNNQQIENNAFYAFCGNMRRDFYRCDKLGLGTHTITATPYSRTSARGSSGSPLTMTFTIVESDKTKPKLLNFVALTSTTVDVSNAPATVEFQLTVQDDASGIRGGLLGFSPSESAIFSFPFGSDLNTLFFGAPNPTIAADNNDAVTFNVVMQVSQFLSPGTFPLQLTFGDEMRNNADLASTNLASAGFIDSITVLNTNTVDTTGVQLVSLTAQSPLTVNVTLGSATVELAMILQDDISGIDFGVFSAFNDDGFTSITFGKAGSDELQFGYYGNNLPAGVPHTFIVSLPFDAVSTPPGTYPLDIYCYDGVKNDVIIDAPMLAAMGFPSSITVVS